MGNKIEAIDEALKMKLVQWMKDGIDFQGLTMSSKLFSIVEYNPHQEWIIVKSNIYPPYNILDYKTLLRGIQMELDGKIVICNSNDYSTKIEDSPIIRKVGHGTSSVSILTKYYRVIHMSFINWYKSSKNNK